MSLLRWVGLEPTAREIGDQAQRFATALRLRLKRGDFAAAEAALLKGTDADRERMIYGLAETEGSLPLAARWASADPQSAFANVVLGACLVVGGWKIRGDGYADQVDKDAWDPFLQSLERAEEPLYRAASLDPELAEPFAWLIHAATGQEAPQEEVDKLFAEALARQPLHWAAHYKYFNAVTQKWGGSHDAMFAFARDSAQRAPRGSLIHGLIASAYLELALAISSEASARKAYAAVRRQGHAREVVAAYHAWLDATPATVERKLHGVGGGFGPWALNQFAAALYVVGAAGEARAALASLQGEVDPIPWTWIAQGLRERFRPAFVYERACRELGVVTT
jgi:hypothetical protein